MAAAPNASLQEIVVFGATPVPGIGIDAAKIPDNIQSMFAGDLARDGTASLTAALNDRLGSISITDTLADPFQPDILYRGFEASPVLGASQGLAVYENGARINEAFGDAVNWDLIPDFAIQRIDLVSSNPSFGLNALGGALAITMKNGFNARGGEADLSGGSFNQRTGSAQFGANNGRFGIYVAAKALNQDGWRRFANDSVHQFYTDISARGERASIDLSYSYADNGLFGQGAAPVQELAVSRQLDFTGPQNNFNRLNFAEFDASFAFSDSLSVQNVLYARDYDQSVANGNTTRYTACTSAQYAGSLCQADGLSPLRDGGGALIADISAGNTVPIGENDFESIRSRGLGGSLQISDARRLFGHGNQLTAGIAVDTARVAYSSGAELGVINAALMVSSSGIFVATPESSPFSATPVDVGSTSRYDGFYATDTFDASRRLAITASARYNDARLDFADHRGTLLSGANHFGHFNPALGATYRLRRRATVYADYAVTNRAPTMSEIECSQPLKPCVLPANLAGDPPNLRQVVAHTAEIGLRGKTLPAVGAAGGVAWNLSAFRTVLDDDIYAIAASNSSGYFKNIGATRRQGFEAGYSYRGERWSGYAEYSYVDATFQTQFTEHSPSNPHQDANGNVVVLPGDQLPGIPRQRIKFGGDYDLGKHCTVGAELIFVGAQYYRGDESNQNPELPAYHVLTVHSSYRIAHDVEIFGSIQNLLDERYATFGLFGDPTGVGAPGIPAGAGSNDPRVDNRFQSPAAPRAYFAGIRVRF
ncbi:MAG TPA: TonB-dependent receptor [Steroidobacteraceae bacterium]|nr:TonB-dependent receptor [Steroidobacteraceae bacterium]